MGCYFFILTLIMRQRRMKVRYWTMEDVLKPKKIYLGIFERSFLSKFLQRKSESIVQVKAMHHPMDWNHSVGKSAMRSTSKKDNGILYWHVYFNMCWRGIILSKRSTGWNYSSLGNEISLTLKEISGNFMCCVNLKHVLIQYCFIDNINFLKTLH